MRYLFYSDTKREVGIGAIGRLGLIYIHTIDSVYKIGN